MLPGEASPWPQELPQPVWLQLPEWCQLALKLVDAVGPQGAERYPQLQVWMPYYWVYGTDKYSQQQVGSYSKPPDGLNIS